MYDVEEKYLYEILEDYKEAENDEQKDEIFHSFCSQIWSSPNKRRVMPKAIKYKVKDSLMDTELGRVFDIWSEVEYVGYSAMTKHLEYASLIRQKVNNIYTNMFDKRICLSKEYMDLLRTPKSLYMRWIRGEDMDVDSVVERIDEAMASADAVKDKYTKYKMDMTWDNYKKQCEKYFLKLFQNYICIDEYEDETQLSDGYDIVTEDAFCVSYFCKGLDGYFKNFQIERSGITRNGKKNAAEYLKRCKDCGKLIKFTGNKKMYCEECRSRHDKERHIKYNHKRTTNRKCQ